jgi:hypothetical protein
MVWGGLLKDLFPAIYNIAQDKQTLISDYLSWHNDEMVWSVNLLQSFKIGRWKTLQSSLISFTIIGLRGPKGINIGGIILRMGNLKFILIRRFFALVVSQISLGRVFGGLKFPIRLLSLLGWWLMVRISPLIIYASVRLG